MTQIAKPEQTPVNAPGTNAGADAGLTRGDSRPVRFELIDKSGRAIQRFERAEDAAMYAKLAWPDQEQDPDRTGAGWDVEAV